MSVRKQSARQRQGVRLCQAYPPLENKPETDVDIIAIHGLDTKSPDTWVWRTSSANKHGVNWLADPDMLPDLAKRARIFYCDWPATLFNEQSTIEMTITELARCLLLAIHSRPGAEKNRPLLFIASCLGGVILSQALVIAARPGSEYASLWRATGGVVFLATPFRGTAFEDMARAAIPFLKGYARLADRAVTGLLDSVTASTPFLQDLVRDFTRICHQRDQPCRLAIFYEAKKSNLLRKAPFLPQWAADSLKGPKVLVDRGSASLDIVENPVALERNHVQMNKFDGPGDPGYAAVAGKIQKILDEICEASPLKRADDWIRCNHYTPDRLEIERLSGETLPIEQCYINLAPVEQPGEIESRIGEGGAQRSSPFSLAARLKIETPEKDIQVDLRRIFEKREWARRPPTEPRRILVRGRAGVGKTTLCKKIVHDFIYHGMWKELFDRILWVPLRNLKTESKEGYNLGDLFFREYLSQTPKGKDLAHELWVALEATNYRRTLFVLDGLDEVSGELDERSKAYPLLQSLLKLPNVIITSRPHGSLPYWLQRTFELELETIGFYPDQVKDYITNVFTSPETGKADWEKVNKVQSFLRNHQLIQGLGRIPIILDALCYTWDDFDSKTIPQTMTAVYQAIEQRLWKKDAVKLEKQTQAQMQVALRGEVRSSIQTETYLLEVLAFTGMLNDVIAFEPNHRDLVFEQFEPPRPDLFVDETLNQLSFIRTSSPPSKGRNRNYHFLHLTFQEYFAARYFVRQWKNGEQLMCLMLSSGGNEQIDPVEFLRRHKYHARYDILWRFIAGLLDDAKGDEETLRFFKVVNEKPLDLLGPTHQRLVVHCLSEVRHQFRLRRDLEIHLSRWLVFQCEKLKEWCPFWLWKDTLASENEFPEQAIFDVLQEKKDEVRMITLRSIESRHEIPLKITTIVTGWLQGDISDKLAGSVLHLFGSSRNQLPGDTLKAIMARLDNQDPEIKKAAIYALGGQSNLQEEALKQITDRLEDEDPGVRMAAIDVLSSPSSLDEVILNQIVARLEDRDHVVRNVARYALSSQVNLPQGSINQIASRLGHPDWEVKVAALNVLRSQSNLPKVTLNQIAALLKDPDWVVRRAAIEALERQSNLPEATLNQIAARLGDQDSDIRRAAIDALRSQWNLLEVTPNQIAAQVNDPNRNVRIAAIEALEHQSNLSEDTLNQIAAQLNDPNRDVRIAAIESLEHQSNLSEDILNQIAVLLGDKDSDIRKAATDALSSRSNLPEVTLNQIAALLEDQDLDVKTASIDTLGSKSNLPEGVLKKIARQLKGHDLFAVDRVAPMIMERHEFHSVCLVGGHAQGLLPLLLQQSFNNHLAWYIQDGKSCLETDNGLGCVGLLHGKSNVEVAIQRAREHAAVPAVGAPFEAELEYSALKETNPLKGRSN
ncbi:hypothetical protein AbraIFM66951_005023 [Aspergillus brasiliensis]|uniref:NACHT domain-containing protein n=1 Tax=Aspergillus brasiliensis TaxID=319629 RepID=A0A9W6DTE6_9EURO|nr:hypothetical protein AbraCBS73388_003213 [Aspergillus brasiliensis]GKZ51089.1 hypothetical protein AbraIFM66951_005023 [Aspergillus brasiliensis]